MEEDIQTLFGIAETNLGYGLGNCGDLVSILGDRSLTIRIFNEDLKRPAIVEVAAFGKTTMEGLLEPIKGLVACGRAVERQLAAGHYSWDFLDEGNVDYSQGSYLASIVYKVSLPDGERRGMTLRNLAKDLSRVLD